MTHVPSDRDETGLVRDAQPARRIVAGRAGRQLADVRRPSRKRRVRSDVGETAIVRTVLEYLQRHKLVAKAWRQNSGAFKVEQRYIRVSSEPGIPDICGFLWDGRALYVECKAKKGKLSYWQKRFLEDALEAGCVCGVARSIEDAQLIVEQSQELIPKRPFTLSDQGFGTYAGFPVKRRGT